MRPFSLYTYVYYPNLHLFQKKRAIPPCIPTFIWLSIFYFSNNTVVRNFFFPCVVIELITIVMCVLLIHDYFAHTSTSQFYQKLQKKHARHQKVSIA